MATAKTEKLFGDLEGFYGEVIDQMDDKFTSHDFIQKLSQLHQDIYAQLLNEYSEKGQPFQTVHGVIAKRLKNNWKHVVEHIDTEHKSENIFGNYNDAAVWRKVK
jgi:regulator of sigma D